MSGIYIASKTEHAHRWRFLRDKVGEPIISTWIDEAGSQLGDPLQLVEVGHGCVGDVLDQ